MSERKIDMILNEFLVYALTHLPRFSSHVIPAPRSILSLQMINQHIYLQAGF